MIEQIARHLPSDVASKSSWLMKVEDALKPFIADQGLDWELHIVETERDLWRIHGIEPPLLGTEAERSWARKNRPVPFEKL